MNRRNLLQTAAESLGYLALLRVASMDQFMRGCNPNCVVTKPGVRVVKKPLTVRAEPEGDLYECRGGKWVKVDK